jgi:uncharacterized membrane protein YeaQ/YmgE (transglycosylase-associated protein family)
MMNLILLIIFGALVGWIASIIMKTNSRQGLLGDMILGILGALLGGYVMTLLGYEGITGFNIYSILVGIGGSILVLLIWRLISRAT